MCVCVCLCVMLRFSTNDEALHFSVFHSSHSAYSYSLLLWCSFYDTHFSLSLSISIPSWLRCICVHLCIYNTIHNAKYICILHVFECGGHELRDVLHIIAKCLCDCGCIGMLCSVLVCGMRALLLEVSMNCSRRCENWLVLAASCYRNTVRCGWVHENGKLCCYRTTFWFSDSSFCTFSQSAARLWILCDTHVPCIYLFRVVRSTHSTGGY